MTDRWGIDDRFEDAHGAVKQVPASVRRTIRRAIGTPPPPARSLFDRPVVVLRQGDRLAVPAAADLALEDGSAMRVSGRLPGDLPIGYHDLTSTDGRTVRIIVSPARCFLPPDLRIWGWSAQVYATRSESSWGLGDLGDLARLARWASRAGAGLVMINPLQAVLPATPQEASPYSPSSRRYLNPLYLRIEDVPGPSTLGPDLRRWGETGRALNAERRLDRDRVFRLKQEALEALWTRFHGDDHFDRYRTAQGDALRRFAAFCVLAEHLGADWRRWPAEYRRPDSPAVQAFARDHADRVEFHEWLQWLADGQLQDAAAPVRIMHDLPVGFSPAGADAWEWQDCLAMEMSVGAPPDLFSVDGQDWGLPPFVPHKLQSARYEPFIHTIRAILRHGGGLRIDHVMGLFRLWWIPAGHPPGEGAYVRYPAKDLLAIVALESQRARAIVVGEDLGTVEEGVREELSAHDILSYRLLWFEETPPSQYPVKALAAVSTHDLPTIAGVWTGADVETQRRLGLKVDESNQEKLKAVLAETTRLPPGAQAEQVIAKTYEGLAQAPSAVVMASLEDACAVTTRPNMPGAAGSYPNWSLALPLTLEQIESAPLPQAIARVLQRRSAAPKRAGLRRSRAG
ncbi:4-alpha-glucanotransferase [Candidatus Nitrospira bockiana]